MDTMAKHAVVDFRDLGAILRLGHVRRHLATDDMLRNWVEVAHQFSDKTAPRPTGDLFVIK